MSPVELTAAAGIFAVVIAVIGLAATAIYRIGKVSEATARIPLEMKIEVQRIHDRIDQHEALNREQFRHNEELIRNNEDLIRRNEELAEERSRRSEILIHHVEELVRIEAERTREQIRNLHQAIMSHSHDEDGNVMFRVPPLESDQQ